MTNPDLIDRYFEGALSESQREEFEALLENDKAFREEFMLQKDLKKVLEANKRKEIKRFLQDVEQRVSQTHRLSFLRQEWIVAASLILVFSLGIWGVKNAFFPSPDRIYADYFSPLENTVQPVTRGEQVMTIEYRAFVAYESEDYHKAINLFSSVKNPEDSYIELYKSMCYLSLNKYDEAMALLENIIGKNRKSSDELEWSQKAQWYLALCHLEKGDEEQAEFYLNRLLENNWYDFKTKEAKQILSFLD